MNNRGILIVLSGFSGAGKGTVVKNILKTYPDEYAVSVSATTRAPREGETDGREYFFKSTSEFQKMIATGELIEYAQYVGNYYGTPRRYVEEQLEAGKNIILEIEIQGAFNIKKMFPDAVLMFLMPPTRQSLKTVCVAGEQKTKPRLKRVLPVRHRKRKALKGMTILLSMIRSMPVHSVSTKLLPVRR